MSSLQDFKDAGYREEESTVTSKGVFKHPGVGALKEVTHKLTGPPCCLVANSCLTLLQLHRLHQAPLSMEFSEQVYWS